jgi:MFS family permease
LTTAAPASKRQRTAGRQPLALLQGLWSARRTDPSIMLGLLSGVIDGALFGMLSVHLLRAGWGASDTAWMLTVFGLGGLLSQLPLGWLTDRCGVSRAAAVMAYLGTVGAALLWLATPLGMGLAVAVLGALAACGLTLSTIAATAHARQTDGDMVVAISRVSMAFTGGSAMGPLVAGFAMDVSARFALPLITVAGCLGLMRWSGQQQELGACATR